MRWNSSALYRLRLIALTFVEQEEEGFIFDDRSTDIRVELVVVDRSRAALTGALTVVGIMVSEVVIRVANPAVVHPCCSSVPGVGAALHIEQDRRPALNAKLRRRCFLHAQFLDCLRRERNRRNTKNSGLVNSRVAVVAVICCRARQ